MPNNLCMPKPPYGRAKKFDAQGLASVHTEAEPEAAGGVAPIRVA